MEKTYSYAIDWAVYSEKCPKLIWHNEPKVGGTFKCEENVEIIRLNAIRILRTYTQSDYVCNYSATSSCEQNEVGMYCDVLKDIELAVIAPCRQSNINMIRVRIVEDWQSWIKSVSDK